MSPAVPAGPAAMAGSCSAPAGWAVLAVTVWHSWAPPPAGPVVPAGPVGCSASVGPAAPAESDWSGTAVPGGPAGPPCSGATAVPAARVGSGPLPAVPAGRAATPACW
ncbi:PE-PGRS family protein [Mycobacterium tuberculosis variant bovis]|nr:PE-PGRS family protein [Mycobacterium tuberculosis variant bovis]CEJ37654.1 PE-PGRS family protein [Mycobacterium tuberculosis variant bovis]CEJ40975.1 PE-PGRS family protein [Mycobacterium tuberculosis variant bovis]CEJ52176.1 PE-PGRS family protein [Mycobacterium tuberculosis variant caprae]